MSNVTLKFTPDRHESITQKANEDLRLLNDNQLEFVIHANKSQDFYQTESQFHFDNCAFQDGVDFIARQWTLIQNSGDKYGDVALAAFGRLLHTVQDFYSHSNWIELHDNEAIIPVWDMNLQNLPPDIVSGTWVIGAPKRCRSGTPTHGQLNKDSDSKTKSPQGCKPVTSGPNQGKILFQLAFDTAVAATCKQFEQFKELKLAARPLLKAVSRPISPDATPQERQFQLIESMSKLKD
jgi:hypothetical protein